MSELTEQIKAKCATIAENQKKVYDLGFKEGKASVKHIYFSILYKDGYFCAFLGMTWREYVTSSLNRGEFSIKGNVVFYNDELLDTEIDDEIVEDGIYIPLYSFTVYDGRNTYTLYKGEEWGILDFINSNQNTIGLYIDEVGEVRTPEGKYLYLATYGDAGYPIVDNSYGWFNSSYHDEFVYGGEFITERKANCYFVISLDWERDCYCHLGMTWEEYADSAFSDAIKAEGGEVYHEYGYFSGLTLNGVKVLPTDVIVNGATYVGVME